MEENSSSSLVKPLLHTPCCLAHVFSHVAALNPHKVAVIHATSRSADAALDQGGVVAEEDDTKNGRSKRDDVDVDVDVDVEEFESSPAEGRSTKTTHAKLDASGERVRIPSGDVTYTFQEIQGAVESLAIRLGYEFSIAAEGNRLAAGGIGGFGPYPSFVQNSTPKVSQDNEGNRLKYDSTSYCNVQNEKMARSPVKNLETTHITRRVGVWMVQSCEYLVSILAILKAGFIFIPLDPSWPMGRLRRVLQSAKLELLLGCKHSLWAPHSLDLTKLHELELAAGCRVLWLPEDYIKSCYKEYDAIRIDADDGRCAKQHQRLWCYVLHTSGSSGTPKGVCGTEKGLLNRLQWMENAYPHVNADVGCFKTAIGFVDHLTEALGPLLIGVPLVIPSPDILKENLLSLINFIEDFKITRLTAVPSLIRAILPALQSRCHQLRTSLRVLVLSGEPLPREVWRQLQSILGDTTILNLYGSTELSGDSSCFNCTNLLEDSGTLSKFSEKSPLFTLSIGEPITGCFYFIVVDDSKLAGIEEEGELWVGGLGVAHSYLSDPGGTREKFINLSDDNEDDGSLVYRQLKKLMQSIIEKLGSTKFRKFETSDERSVRVFKTGDIVKRLANGHLVLLGRKDRQLKIRGHRIALEEIEINTEQHLKVKSVAVIPRVRPGSDEMTMVAYVVPEGQNSNFILKQEEPHTTTALGVRNMSFETELKIWLAERLPQVMVPETFVFLANLPMTMSGKTDYKTLATTFRVQDVVGSSAQRPPECDLPGVEYIRKVLAWVLRTENLLPTEDFFSAGGTSISAAHASHILGIDMRVLYTHPSAMELHSAIGDRNGTFRDTTTTDGINHVNRNFVHHTQEHVNSHQLSSSLDVRSGTDLLVCQLKTLKRKHLDYHIAVDEITPSKEWGSCMSNFTDVAFTRCNRMIHLTVSSREGILPHNKSTVPWEIRTLNNKKWCIQQRWRVSLRSCVDASPLLVCHKNVYRLFIGSHSHNLLSVDATSGEVIWEAQLRGRIESSATITQDSSEVVVGCYDGLIYFIDFWDGQVVWSFETSGEVKCQPTLDPWTGLIWCGSHDHHIYVLDTSARKCVWQHDCGGSIFGAPAFDEVKNIVFIATTNGTLIAIKSKPTIHVIWTYKVGTPMFGSLAVDPSTETIICTSVNGSVYALNAYGKLVWEVKTDGPIFAGATISSALPTQVLVCSGDSHVYCLNLKDGGIEWKHNVGYPITSSAYVDENLVLSSDDGTDKRFTKRLVCVASTSGTLCVFQSPSKRSHIKTSSDKSHSLLDIEQSEIIPPEKTSQAVTQVTLPGEVFSSPVMMCGRIFVGCRNDYLYCLDLLI